MESTFINSCLENGLTQVVDEVTRPYGVTGSEEGTILDLLLTSNNELIEDLKVSEPPLKTDHKAVVFSAVLPSPRTTDQGEKGNGYDFRRGDYDQIAANLSLTNWKNFFSTCMSASEMYFHFLAYLHYLLDLFVPLRRMRGSRYTALRRYIQRLSSQIKGQTDARLHNRLTKAVTRIRILEESEVDFKDAKSFFRYANRRIKGRELIGAILADGCVLKNDEEKANAFASHFSNTFVISSFTEPELQSTGFKASSLCFTRGDILNKIKSLPAKCSFTPDGVPPLVYKKLGICLVEPLYLIYQRSYWTGDVPDAFRLSIITPVFKSGSKFDVKNYRPIAQCSIACIVFEKLLVDHISRYLYANQLFDKEQHGFMRGKSTATQLVTMTHEWALHVNNKRNFDCVYFDLSKAFDRVNHGLLLKKLSATGLDDRSVSWVKCYLEARSFVVKVNDTLGTSRESPSGVPQGSCLGPLLFCIFIMDIKSYIPSDVSYKLYADDLKLYASVSDEHHPNALQGAIDQVAKWCDDNGMEISVPKCAVVRYGSSNQIYFLRNQAIQMQTSVRDLGICITPQLDFSSHLTKIVQGANAIVNTIFRTFIIKRPEFYIKLYRSLVVPRLIYCCEIWRPYQKKYIEALERVQIRFVRRTARRCNVKKDAIELQTLCQLYDRADSRMYNKLRSLQSLDNFFDIRPNVLRSTETVRTLEVARTERVNQMFSWRVARAQRRTSKKQLCQ